MAFGVVSFENGIESVDYWWFLRRSIGLVVPAHIAYQSFPSLIPTSSHAYN